MFPAEKAISKTCSQQWLESHKETPFIAKDLVSFSAIELKLKHVTHISFSVAYCELAIQQNSLVAIKILLTFNQVSITQHIHQNLLQLYHVSTWKNKWEQADTLAQSYLNHFNLWYSYMYLLTGLYIHVHITAKNDVKAHRTIITVGR